jgi:cystathionine gamma-synthase
VRIITQATSLGGVESTMERRQKYVGDAHVNPGLIRMSVGIEDVEDLWRDLVAALAS